MKMWPKEHVERLVNIIQNSYNDPCFSDIKIKLRNGKEICCHKLVLSARSDIWYTQLVSQSPTTSSNINNNNTMILSTQKPPSPNLNSSNINISSNPFGDDDDDGDSKPIERCKNDDSFKTRLPNSSVENGQEEKMNNLSLNCIINDHVQSRGQEQNNINSLDFSDWDESVVECTIKWVYTNSIGDEFKQQTVKDEKFVFGVMKFSRKLRLTSLVTLCERALLSLAPNVGLDRVARLLMEGKGNMNIKNDAGLTLLHLAIENGDERGAMFLLQNSADVNIKTPKNQTTLELSIRQKLPKVVHAICAKDYDLKNTLCSNGDPPIWLALAVCKDEEIASILVEFSCDTNCWYDVTNFGGSNGGGGRFRQNLLHRALDANDESTACFLIRSGCDVNSPRSPLADGTGDEEAFDGQTPLHLACAWGLEKVVQTLLEHHADINAQDSEGKTPLHVAIINQNSSITMLLVQQTQLDLRLRDKYGQSPFATAMFTKNNHAAEIILGREPHAAEKFDPKGRTFLHLAIQKNDLESVLFLLSVRVNVHSRVKDTSKWSPLHLAVDVGSEMIVRNLLLAGANINDLTVQNQTALHLAAAKDHYGICKILIENNINFDAVDHDLNNALHLACQNGNLATCRVLLTESGISAEARNLRGRNPIHLLAMHGKENSAAIFELFITSMPEYPINVQDAEGDTPLLLAYKNGNKNLCRALIRTGACLGSTNRMNINIFNAQVASKRLLYLLLDYLPQEPPWTDGDSCLECQAKFSITNRKHHCRHCGRILCAKCSPKEMQIIKFKSPKPVRVCMICYDALSYGDSHTT